MKNHPAEIWLAHARRSTKSKSIQKRYLTLAMAELNKNPNPYLLAIAYYWQGNASNRQEEQAQLYHAALFNLDLIENNDNTPYQLLRAKIYIGLGNAQASYKNGQSHDWYTRALETSSHNDIQRKAFIGLANAYRSHHENISARFFAQQALKLPATLKQKEKINHIIQQIDEFTIYNQELNRLKKNKEDYSLFPENDPFNSVIETIKHIKKSAS